VSISSSLAATNYWISCKRWIQLKRSEGQTDIDRLSNLSNAIVLFPLDSEPESQSSVWGEPIHVSTNLLLEYTRTIMQPSDPIVAQRESYPWWSLLAIAPTRTWRGSIMIATISFYSFVMPHEKPETLSKKERLDIIFQERCSWWYQTFEYALLTRWRYLPLRFHILLKRLQQPRSCQSITPLRNVSEMSVQDI
jgi:hypothetical protein